MQVVRSESRRYPDILQEHSYPPESSVHFCEHGFDVSEHSWISKQEDTHFLNKSYILREKGSKNEI